MPNAHDEDKRNLVQDAAASEGVAVPETVDDAAQDAASEAVLEAEVLDVEEAGASEADSDDVAEAEIVETEPDEEGAPSDARPSVHGRLAKPHAGKDAGADKAKRKAHKPGFARRVVLGIIVAVLAAMLVVTGLFCWQKWMRFDDTADIQGVWKVQSTGDTIVFDGRNLKLTKGISYEYRLDTQEKSIAYRFGELAGGGHYYFSGDRDVLVIIDGDERLGILAEAGFLPDELVNADDANDEKTVLVKVSDDTSAEPSGTATGVSTGKTMGEREYVVKPEPSTSSSSKKKRSESTKSEDEEEEDAANRGFIDEDGDGYDDETDLEYEDFLEYQESLNAEDEDAEGEDAEGEADGEDEGDSELAEEADVEAEWGDEADTGEEYE